MIEELTPEMFRLKISGLIDKGQEIRGLDNENIKNEAIRFTSILAKLFGSDLDRKTLWERIGSALVSSSLKHSDNIEEFINSCLRHIKAEFYLTASNEEIKSLIDSILLKDKAWHEEFLSYIEKNQYIILIYARKRWEEYKEGKIEL